MGTWVICDREGRFKWEPHEMHLHILPYHTFDEFDAAIDLLWEKSLLIRYEFVTESFGWIPGFLDHQKPRADEAQSKIPPHDAEGTVVVEHPGNSLRTRNDVVTKPRRGTGTELEPKGREHKRGAAENSPTEIWITEIITYLATLTGRGFNPDTKANRKELRRAFERDGATYDKCLAIIDFKWKEWGNNAEMSKHVNPITLFRASNFQKYLAEIEAGTPVGAVTAPYHKGFEEPQEDPDDLSGVHPDILAAMQEPRERRENDVSSGEVQR